MFAWQKRQATVSRSTSTTFIVEARRPIPTLQRRSSSMARNALGRGLGALIRDSEVAPTVVAPTTSTAGAAAAVAPAQSVTGGLLQVDIDLGDPSPVQPRTRFSE